MLHIVSIQSQGMLYVQDLTSSQYCCWRWVLWDMLFMSIGKQQLIFWVIILHSKCQ